MKNNQLLKEFQDRENDYKRMGVNIVESLKILLDEQQIPYLDIHYRVKNFNSFLEKIIRKNYAKPFHETEDLCGVRVVCYYISDVERINEIIRKEFEILESKDKSEELGPKEFGYRSQHFIVKIAKSWLSVPTYRNLGGLKSELQIRTVLMHAWAEIEHKLNYKSVAQVPKEFQRDLNMLSADLEGGDKRFEELRVRIKKYKLNLIKRMGSQKYFDFDSDFNLETFKLYISWMFPQDNWSDSNLAGTFEAYSKYGITFREIDAAVNKSKPHMEDILKDLKSENYSMIDSLPDSHILLHMALDCTNEESLQERKVNVKGIAWLAVMEKWNERLNKST